MPTTSRVEPYYVETGERVRVEGGYSEVMMHLGLAGKEVEIAIVADRFLNGNPAPGFMAQVYVDGLPFSFPILPCEAGFYRDGERYYTYPCR